MRHQDAQTSRNIFRLTKAHRQKNSTKHYQLQYIKKNNIDTLPIGLFRAMMMKQQMNITWLKILAARRQTSWRFTKRDRGAELGLRASQCYETFDFK